VADLIIAGIGNPYRRDDAAGWAVIEALEKKVTIPLQKTRGDIGELLELFSRYGTVYLIDASLSKKTGSWQRIDALQEELPLDNPQTSTHDLSVSEAISLAKNLDQLPAKLIVYAIAGDQFHIGQGLSPLVGQAVDKVAEALLNEEDICMNLA
jgi:hydrogenase maturation protease